MLRGGGVGRQLPRTSGKALSEVTHGGLSTNLCSGGPTNTCPGGELGGGKWCWAGAKRRPRGGGRAGPGLGAAVESQSGKRPPVQDMTG